MPAEGRRELPADDYARGILLGDRSLLARAITIVESDKPEHRSLSQQVIGKVLPHTGRSRRVGVTGIPGAGKSTFIDALGMHIIKNRGESIAVLSIDPSSTRTGGSILGDKTRMENLAREDAAYIRPSPSRGALGGVARATREAMLLCEAAGFQNVFIETVGVGQSESEVRSLTDFFLLLLVAGAGDELQGIKRGIVEMSDLIAINKADGDNEARARQARDQYTSALHLFPLPTSGWRPQAVTCSALTQSGIPEVWNLVLAHRSQLESTGALLESRRQQAVQWTESLIRQALSDMFFADPAVAREIPKTMSEVARGQISPIDAAQRLLSHFNENRQREIVANSSCGPHTPTGGANKT